MKRLLFCCIMAVLPFFSFAQENDVIVRIETSQGNIDIKLYNDTPLHRDNFIKLVKEGYYNDLLFHRVIRNFMIQGGDPNSRNAAKGEMLGVGGPDYTVPAEIRYNRFHKRGAIAAARKGDSVNPLRESSGSQFYIVQGQVFTEAQLASFRSMENSAGFTTEQVEAYTSIGGSPHLDWEYTVFGEVTEGFDVLEKISQMSVDAYNRPVEDVSYRMYIITE
jgi:cyclophilin family peptidyl-prolyl cis-trans isomerase